MDERTHTIRVPGLAYSDYLDPRLGTEMATILHPYFGWKERYGSSWSYLFTEVPHEIVLDLVEDMGNVAEMRSANGEFATAQALRRTVARINKALGLAS